MDDRLKISALLMFVFGLLVYRFPIRQTGYFMVPELGETSWLVNAVLGIAMLAGVCYYFWRTAEV